MNRYDDLPDSDMAMELLKSLECSSSEQQQVLAASALELFMQEHEYELALRLLSEYPELRKSDYITSPRFADDLFYSSKLGDLSVLRVVFEKFGLPVHIQDRSEFNLLEYGVSEQLDSVVTYAHRVLGLHSDKSDSLYSYMSWEGNKTMLRYLKYEVGLAITDTDKVVESCVRSKEIDMVQFAAEEMGVTDIHTIDVLDSAIIRAAEAGQLKPLQDLIDFFCIHIDPLQVKRRHQNVEVRDEAVAVYLKEVLKLVVVETYSYLSSTALHSQITGNILHFASNPLSAL